MSNYIDFKSSVDEWYRTQSADNSWAKVLTSLTRSYAQANDILGLQGEQANALARQGAQAEVSSLYSQYRSSRQGLGTAGFTSSFQKGVTSNLKGKIGASASGVYNQAIANASVQTQALDMTKSDLYKAYEREVAGVSSVWENIFSYFNLDDDNYTDTEYAASAGLLDASGKLTAKGQMYLKYYLNTDATGFGDESTDPYYLDKGSLGKYLQDEVSDLDANWVSTVSSMSGVDLQNLTYSQADKEAILGKGNVTSVDSNDIKPVSDLPKVLQEKDAFTYALEVGMRGGRADKVDRYKQVEDSLKGITDAWVKGDGNQINYIMNEKKTADIGFQLYNAGLTGYTADENGWSWDNLKVNGINVEEAIKYGALSNGDIFSQDGITYIVYDNQPRIYLNSSTIKKLESLNIKIQ